MLPLLIGATQFLKGGIGLASAYSEANAYERQAELELIKGDYYRQTGESNAKFSDFIARDIESQEAREVGKVKRRAGQVRGAQRAAAAAQGIDVGDGSAQQLQDETEAISEQDMLTVKTNVWREAFGYKKQAAEYRHQGTMAQLETRFKANALRSQADATRFGGWASLLTGGLGAASGAMEQFGGGSALSVKSPGYTVRGANTGLVAMNMRGMNA
jgi:hypothetical protein